MSNFLVLDNQTKTLRKASDVEVVDKILELKTLKGPWDVIEELIKIWYEKSPEDVQGVLISIGDMKGTRKDPLYGQTDDKNMGRRLIMVFPMGLQHLIRKVYSAEELPFDKKFFQEFATRFKAFQVPEKI